MQENMMRSVGAGVTVSAEAAGMMSSEGAILTQDPQWCNIKWVAAGGACQGRPHMLQSRRDLPHPGPNFWRRLSGCHEAAEWGAHSGCYQCPLSSPGPLPVTPSIHVSPRLTIMVGREWKYRRSIKRFHPSLACPQAARPDTKRWEEEGRQRK